MSGAAEVKAPTLDRRLFFQLGTAGMVGLASGNAARAGAGDKPRKPTEFQIACMTLPYSQFPFEQRFCRGH